MQFERFPNEILLEIFAYCDSVDLFVAFADRNARFRALAYHRILAYGLDIHQMRKRHFDCICQQRLSAHLGRLQLVEKIDLFSSYVPFFHRFTRPRSPSFTLCKRRRNYSSSYLT